MTRPPAAAGLAAHLWAMVGIQFIMTMSFTILSPIMPLFLPDLGVNGAVRRSICGPAS